MLAATIDEVLAQLDAIVSQPSRLGFFAALYRKVTARVKAGIGAGRFEDGPQMERLDVVFANRYLDAYTGWQAGTPVSDCWRIAFEATSRSDLAVLQHLLLGMNAHIHLDLGIAVSEVSVSRRDFDEINHVLLEILNEIQEDLARVSPWFALLEWAGGSSEEAIAGFTLVTARDIAWRHSELMAASVDSPGTIATMDTVVRTIGFALLHPPLLTRAALRLMAFREPRDPSTVLRAIS
jgi:hypothetical protein